MKNEALIDQADYIIEMNSGFSHSPHQLIFFVYGLLQGNDCVFGYRSLTSLRYRGSNFRRFVSLGGAWISSGLLGTRLRDITSGYEGFTSNALKKIIHKPFLSSAHFWYVELKARAREMKYIEVPITYQFPSPRMNFSSILNSLAILSILVLDRLKGK
ncbi:MAG: dolichol-phosphate mannosyltransferase [Patescibacteria group bacterium]|jgi:dolichol-phosphate mannosyltransferase|nr:dolichol-phosphate mannosyltransferase [Patescibacteria group bacterium]